MMGCQDSRTCPEGGPAHALDALASAEGVETPQQLAALRATGCDCVAGFLLAHPQPEAEPMPTRALGDEGGAGSVRA
jgi:EAL domain-containing protein (putative c-di-GMP-specific phosphodiesterase class I)